MHCLVEDEWTWSVTRLLGFWLFQRRLRSFAQTPQMWKLWFFPCCVLERSHMDGTGLWAPQMWSTACFWKLPQAGNWCFDKMMEFLVISGGSPPSGFKMVLNDTVADRTSDFYLFSLGCRTLQSKFIFCKLIIHLVLVYWFLGTYFFMEELLLFSNYRIMC